jgi:hypothetical protein
MPNPWSSVLGGSPQQPATPQHATIQDARAAGAVEGTMLMAPLAPASGPITVGVADVVPAKTEKLADGSTVTTPAKEPMVVVVLKTFWTSATVIWLRRLVAGAFGGAFVIVLEPYAVGGKSWADFTLLSAWPVFSHAFEVAILAALFAYWKTRDNNAIK